MAFEENPLGVSRRTILSGIGATIGGSALLADVGNALPLGNTKYVGKSYDPLSDQEQADASADLTFTPFGVIGELSVAGFTIPLGEDKPLSRLDSKGNVDTYAFVKDDAEFTVRDRVGGEERDLPLRGRFDVVNGHIVGSLSRPTSKWGEISFTLAPEDEGLTPDGVGQALGLKGKHEISLYDDSSAIPDRGIPTSNSIANAPAAGDVEPSMYLPRPPIGGGGSGDDGDDDGSDGGDGDNGDDGDDDNDDGGGGGGSPDLDPEPDLRVTYVSVDDQKPDACSELTVKFAVKNEGNGIAHNEGAVITADWLQGDVDVTIAQTGLSPGDIKEYSRKIKAPYRPTSDHQGNHEIEIVVRGYSGSSATTIYPQVPDDACTEDPDNSTTGDTCMNNAAYVAANSKPGSSDPTVNYSEEYEYFHGTSAKVYYAPEDSPGPRVETMAAYEIEENSRRRIYLEGAFSEFPESPIRDCHIDNGNLGNCWDEGEPTAYQRRVEFEAEIVKGDAEIVAESAWPDGVRDADQGALWKEYLRAGLDIVSEFSNHPLAKAGLKVIQYAIPTDDPAYDVSERDSYVSWALPVEYDEFPNHFSELVEKDDEEEEVNGGETAVSFQVYNQIPAGETMELETTSRAKYTVVSYAVKQHDEDGRPECDLDCRYDDIEILPKENLGRKVTNTAKFISIRNTENPCRDDNYKQ